MRSTPSPIPGDPLEVIRTDAPWTARAGGLLRIAWVPLVLALVTRAVSGWRFVEHGENHNALVVIDVDNTQSVVYVSDLLS